MSSVMVNINLKYHRVLHLYFIISTKIQIKKHTCKRLRKNIVASKGIGERLFA